MKIVRLLVACVAACAFFAAPAFASKCDITEYQMVGQARLAAHDGTPLAGSAPVAQIAQEPGTDQTPMTVTGTASQSSAFATTTYLISVYCDAQVSRLIGANPTALLTNKRIPSGIEVYLGVKPGDKISLILNP